MKRPSNSDGDGEAQGFMREPTSPPSLRSAAGGTVIPFPSPAAFAAALSCADARSSLSVSPRGYWLRRRDARRGWTPSFITWVWRLAVDRRRVSQNG